MIASLRSRRAGGVATARRSVFFAGALAALAMLAGPGVAEAKPKVTTNVIPIHVDEVTFVDGQLVAMVSVGTTQIPVPITVGATGTDGDCDILNLSLGPIHLDLLGLVVDTSPICLDVTGDAGAGNLLGNLLCGVAGLLDDGISLGDVLGGLTADELDTLLDGIRDLLNEVLGVATAPAAIQGVSDSGAGTCDVLNLAVGPLDLNLLGLVVALDDCDGGPVTVDITAEAGAGNLLGNLLCSLSHILDSNANVNAINNAINRVANAIAALLL